MEKNGESIFTYTDERVAEREKALQKQKTRIIIH